MMTKATRTYGQLHFTDLEAKRFEMLVLQIIFRMRRWERLDHVGVGGADAGVDVHAIELLENGKRDTHHFQCKRYDKLTKRQLERIVVDYMRDNPVPADYYYVVCGCNPSKKAMDGFYAACSKAGIKHPAIWSASYLEALLYKDYHDILFGFFGINLTNEKNDMIASIRRNIALKKRMHNDFTKKNCTNDELRAIRYDGEYWRRFIHSEVLIRSIYDKNYPDNPTDFPGYFKAEVYNWYHNGLEVRAFPYAVNAKVKQLRGGAYIDSDNQSDYEVVELRLEVTGCISFESIIEYDLDGDEYYQYPHLFCDYPCGSTPFEEYRYRTESGFIIKKEDIIEIL